jgi:PEP-CTERM motif
MSNSAVTVTPTPRGYSMCICFKNSPLKVAAIAVGISILTGGSRVQAGFLEGQTLSLEIQSGGETFFGPDQFVVNNTVEIALNNPGLASFNMEVTDNTITFTFTETAVLATEPFNGYILTAISPGTPPFGSITVDPATTLAGFNASDLSLDSTHFNINVSGLEVFTGTVLKLDVSPAVSSVPEPSSLVLAGLGLLVIGGISRARRRPEKRG